MSESVAPIDEVVLQTIRDRAQAHPLIETVTADRTGGAISTVCATCDSTRYPDRVERARLEIQWYTNGDYNFHYLETHVDETWQCRWDRHPNPHTQRMHFHPPPDARSADAIPDTPSDHHPSALFTRTIANIRDRIDNLWETTDS